MIRARRMLHLGSLAIAFGVALSITYCCMGGA